MQFFSLDGFDLESNVLFVFHMCECVNMLGYCVNVCLHVLDCTLSHNGENGQIPPLWDE